MIFACLCTPLPPALSFPRKLQLFPESHSQFLPLGDLPWCLPDCRHTSRREAGHGHIPGAGVRLWLLTPDRSLASSVTWGHSGQASRRARVFN